MVAVAVLWVWIIIINGLGDDWGGNLGNGWVSQRSGNLGHTEGWVGSWVSSWVIGAGVSDGDSIGDGHDGGEDCELKQLTFE